MAGFPIDPSVLAQLAASGFRPPQPPAMPGLSLSAPSMSLQQTPPAVSLRDGLSTLVAGIQALKDWKPDPTIVNAGPQGSGPGGAYTTADAMAMAGLNDGAPLSPMSPSFGNFGRPGMSGGSALGMPDFLTGAWRGITGLFGGS
jgi:hypothetical protein